MEIKQKRIRGKTGRKAKKEYIIKWMKENIGKRR